MKRRGGLALVGLAWCVGCSLSPFPDLISGHGDAGAGFEDGGFDAGVQDAGVDAGSPLTCDAGFADCDGDRLTCETVLASDDSNCARCGRDCLGGGCNNGTCGAVLLSFDDDAGPLSIGVVDGVPVWTTERDEVRRPGGARGVRVVGTTVGPVSLVAHEGAVAWSSLSGAVEYLPGLDASVRQIVFDRGITWGYPALDDDFIYWAVVDAGVVERAPRDGGPVTVYARLPLVHSVVSGSAVLFAGPSGVFALGADGGNNPITTGVTNATHLAIGGGFAWVCETDNDRVSRIELTSGARVTTDDQQLNAHGIAADSMGAFWATDKYLMFWPADGGPPAPFRDAGVLRIALTPEAIYWTEFAGAVRMQTR